MKIQQITEARDATLEYKEVKVKNVLDRIVVEVSGTQSALFTKLGKQYKDLKNQIEELTETRKAVEDSIQLAAENLFDAEDDVLTRVVETVSITATLSKSYQNKKESTDWESVYHDIVEILNPELEEKVKAIVKKYTEAAKTEKAKSKLTVKVPEAAFSVDDFTAKVKHYFQKFRETIALWADSFDKKLAKTKAKADRL